MSVILVVDDDRAIQELFVDLLTEQGHEVHTCRDGRQAHAELEKRSFDLLVLDVLIPHMNGFLLVEKLRGDPKTAELPIIMISGIYRSRNHRQEMTTKHKVIDYIDKPVSNDKFLELVERVVGPSKKQEKAIDEPFDDLGESVSTEPETNPIPPALPKTERQPAANRRSKEPAERLEEQAEPDSAIVDSGAHNERLLVEAEAQDSFATSAFVLQGSLAKMPLAGILGKLWHQRVSGGLLIRRDKVKKIVYLKNGDPFSVKSNLVSECLGQILLRERLITRNECEESVKRIRSEGKRQGELLVEMGCLTQNNLTFALELQLETKLFDIFTWDDGEYRFNSSAAMAKANTGIHMSGPALVVEGIRRTFDETRLRQQMLPVIDVPLAFREERFNLTEMGFGEREQQAIEAIMPPQTTRDLLDSVPLDPPDTLRVIYSLIALEILEPVT